MKKVLKIIGIVFGAIVFLGIVGVILFVSNLPEKKDYTHLQEPRIIHKPDTNVMMVAFDGDPNVVIGEAYGSLYKAYYQANGFSKLFKQDPPIARYESFDELLKRVEEDKLKTIDWKGFVAVPVDGDLSELLQEAEKGDYAVKLATLEYGNVAEIIHFGPYESEKPTIMKLQNYIEDKGYKITGLHEEEYVKGPGIPFTDPEDYITIIRYQVEKEKG